MSDKNEVTFINEVESERGARQLALMKMVAEQNCEKFITYDCETDHLVLSEIVDGRFVTQKEVNNFFTESNDILDGLTSEDREKFFEEIRLCLKEPRTSVFDIRVNWDGCEKRWYSVFMTSVADERGFTKHIDARLVCVHEQKIAQDRMRQEAERDSLSGVYNRKTYEALCNRITEEHEDGILFMMIDIDNFKQINDTYGHHIGDEVISYVGMVLDAVVRGHGVVGRVGGDEFSVCLHGVYSRETALFFCDRIREETRQRVAGVAFTCSIGVSQSNGRKMDFMQLYFEADEAVYFAKDNGKNQFVFADELETKRKELFQEHVEGYHLTEEEIALDQSLNYCVVLEPGNKKLLYMNEPARQILGLTMEQVRSMYCYQLFKGRCEECTACELHANHVHMVSDEEAEGLKRFIPNGRFMVMGQSTAWKGIPAHIITFADMNDSMHIEQCMEENLETQDALTKCWSLVLESSEPEIDYTKIVRILCEYYDGDCCALIKQNETDYEEIFEYHSNSGQMVAEGLHYALSTDFFEKCEVLFDENGYIHSGEIQRKIKEHPQIAELLERGFVHNAVGMRLSRHMHLVGVLLVVNPKKHLHEYSVLRHIGAYFTSDLARKILSDKKEYAATHDVMTRLWNREYMPKWKDDFGSLFEGGMGVFMADIFGLKEINKNLGYSAGNERLVELADLFRKVFNGYSMFRYDGNQVLAICHNVDKSYFEEMVQKEIELLKEVDFEVSNGYAWKSDASIEDYPELIELAEENLHIHKCYLQKENDAVGKMTRKMEKDLLEQIRNGGFRMFLQPKVNIITGKTVGAEGLIRLYDVEKGIIPPGYFISLLEKHSLVHYVDMFILSRAFQFQYKAKKEGRPMVPISVNFSKNTLAFPKLLSYIRAQCERYGEPEGMIRIEITETISNMDHIEVRNIARELHKMGFSISMDDFGTKYSNMTVLTQFDFDTVKIDRSMVMDIVGNDKKQKILKYLIGMLKELGMEIVVEGVETAEQVTVLKELGCDIVQGFFFGKPEAEEKFYELYMNERYEI